MNIFRQMNNQNNFEINFIIHNNASKTKSIIHEN